MPQHCFCYGSLMCEDILTAVTGEHYHPQRATLTGYRRGPVLGATYPGMVAAAQEQVAGVLYRDVSPAAWAKLDAFEGEEYQRVPVQVFLADGQSESAWAYAFKPEYAHRLGAGEWSFDDFLRHGKARFMAQFLPSAN